jgi:hypothetical protein
MTTYQDAEPIDPEDDECCGMMDGKLCQGCPVALRNAGIPNLRLVSSQADRPERSREPR